MSPEIADPSMAFDVTTQVCRTCLHVQPTILKLQLMLRTLLNTEPTPHASTRPTNRSHVLSYGTTALGLAAKAFDVVQLGAKSYKVASVPVGEPMIKPTTS